MKIIYVINNICTMMKYFKIKNIITVIVSLGAIFLQSCGSDESYDIIGDPTNFLYFRASSQKFEDKPINSYVFNIIRTPVGEEGDKIHVKIPVRVNLPLNSDATVSARINNDLIVQYNTDKGTNYKAFPEGSVDWIKTSVSIKAGSNKSVDSLEFLVPEDQYKHFIESAYLLPIQLVDASAGVISTNESVLWIFVNSEYRQIRANAGVDDILGAIANRTGWNISSTDEPTLNYTACLDGSLTTGVRFSNVEVPTITVDMGKVNKVSGLRLAPYRTTSAYFRLSSVKVELSLDNQSWNILGTADSMATSGSYQLVGFYCGIDARYIRLTLTWSNGSRSGTYRNLHEIDTYIIE